VSVTSTFFVPVAASKAGTLALRTGRLCSGERVGLAFTSEASLLLALGPAQQWIHLGGYALRDMLAPLGVEQVRVDPRPVGQELAPVDVLAWDALPDLAGATGSGRSGR
jgi:hypothetical protein